MSLFKNKGIILKIDKDFQKEFIYHIFTYDYGIIKCNKKISKKEKSLDIGYLINFEILTKTGINIHKIKNIKIIGEQNTLKDFTEINTFLELLSFIYLKIHSKEPFFEVFNIIEFIILDNKINLDKIILANLKIIDLLGELDIENKNIIIKKILNFINKNSFKEIIRLKLNDENIKNTLSEITKESLSR